jgi:hypothetical protein
MDGWDVVVVACQAGMTVSLDDWVVEAYRASDRVGRGTKAALANSAMATLDDDSAAIAPGSAIDDRDGSMAVVGTLAGTGGLGMSTTHAMCSLRKS